MFKTVMAHELNVNKEMKIIDVRESFEHQNGVIPNALLMPLSQFNDYIPQISKDIHYYVICESGARSFNVCQFLSENGYNVTNVMGGMSAYRGALDYDL